MTTLLLAIEFLDELVFGVQEASWPLIRDELRLDYLQIGILLSLPGIVANLFEPSLFLLGDIWRRRAIILGGGFFFTVSLVFTAITRNFTFLLLALIIFNPSSGAFVSLSQATLMDSQPARREANMARWTFAGSLGVFGGPLLLGGLLAIGFGWRQAFWALAALSVPLLLLARRALPGAAEGMVRPPSLQLLVEGFRQALRYVREGVVLRWLVLLEFSDLMLDVLYGFLALYLVDVSGFSPGEAALGISIWAGSGLLGDFLLIRLVERMPGIRYLHLSVILELLLFPAFLLSDHSWVKLALLGLMGLFNSGWYAILKAKLYESMPGSSASVLVLDNISGIFGRILPFCIGWAANAFGLAMAIWLLMLGPLALLVGLPRESHARPQQG